MDNNLKLAILNNFLSRGTIKFDRYAFLRETLKWTKYKINRFRDKLTPQIEEHFLNYDLNDFDLGLITYLGQNGIMDINYHIWSGFDGMSDHFEINSLDGIQDCFNISELDLANTCIEKIAPIKGLAKLEKIEITSLRPIIDTHILYEMPSLKEVKLYIHSVKEDTYNELKTTLETQGVKVSINE